MAKEKKYLLRIDEETYKKIKAISSNNDKSINKIINEMLIYAIKTNLPEKLENAKLEEIFEKQRG